MCGIFGFSRLQTDDNTARTILLAMSDELRHRGPDAQGEFFDDAIALGHSRLSVLDLSDKASQPMISRDEALVLSFNGEIYNHRQIRDELNSLDKGICWQSSSDTETLLVAFEILGVEQTLSQLEGMFALALYDRKKKRLFLARDRLGEKPLYFGQQGNTVLFASEPHVFYEHPDFQGSIDKRSLALYFRHSYVPAPYSIFNGIEKLLPGQFVSIDLTLQNEEFLRQRSTYWSANDVVKSSFNIRNNNNDANLNYMDIGEAADDLEMLLLEKIGDQMEADVPLGAFLSGGIDSSLIVALLQAQSSEPIRTFTIGFEDQDYDESENARAIANALGTQHTEKILSVADIIEIIPEIISRYSEPFADSSQIPTYLVSKLAREDVTVALSGDGGDELFCGYNRYLKGYDLWRNLLMLPRLVRRALAGILKLLPPQRVDAAFRTLNPILPSALKNRTPGGKMQKLCQVLPIDDERALLHELSSQWSNPEELVGDLNEPPTKLTDKKLQPDIPLGREWMMAVDTQSYLPDDIMTKVDRATMAVSLESRAPFLNHKVFEFAWRLPESFKRGDGEGKKILRMILERYVPREIFTRPKMGFGFPLGRLLRGPLREWAEVIIVDDAAHFKDNLNQATIKKYWLEHLSGKKDHEQRLWSVLIYRLWLIEHRKNMMERPVKI